jgi:hypothetical protein
MLPGRTICAADARGERQFDSASKGLVAARRFTRGFRPHESLARYSLGQPDVFAGVSGAPKTDPNIIMTKLRNYPIQPKYAGKTEY